MGVEKIGVLIVDDDVISRKLLTTVLAREDGIDVVGELTDGGGVVEAIKQLKPDIITLDVEMPVLDGIETLKQVRSIWPRLPVIMYSAHTEEGAAVTLRALCLGASDYVTKPGVGTQSESPFRHLKENLVPKVRAFCSPGAKSKLRSETEGWTSAADLASQATQAEIDIVAVGVSTGGPQALAGIFPNLPEDFPVPIVLVQHMPAIFTRELASVLNSSSRVNVVEGIDGETLRAGTVYIAPGGKHMVVRKGEQSVVVGVQEGDKVNACRPSVDVLFESVNNVFGGKALAVILTGMGQDGAQSCEQLNKSGAEVIIQDENSSVVWGMPGAIARLDIPHTEYALPRIARAISRRVSDAKQCASWQGHAA